ncbi:MAG: heterocyst frequency control protein PatD [Chamaesiphon sp.]|nr:heterocyst frequency control protein PatD [Chamaesiphon sp.]
MLPIEQILMWQQLFTLLSNLPTDSIPDLKVSLDRSIKFFESHIIPQDLDNLPDPIAGKMRSYLTESHRLLRLLPIDLTFIAAARNPATIEQRRQSYQYKLDLLLQYCQAIIKS